MKTREYIKAEENLKRDSEKRYQVKVRRAQEENLTQLRETKKKPKKEKQAFGKKK